MMPGLSPEAAAAFIQNCAHEHGFEQCGFAAPNLEAYADDLRAFLAEGLHGDMAYLLTREAIRCDPSMLLASVRSIIVVTQRYYPPHHESAQTLADPQRAFISRYATGKDYHKVMKKALKQMVQKMRETFLHMGEARFFVDSAPILEKPLAYEAGLAWLGKNTLAMHPEQGSYFFIGTILCDLELPFASTRVASECGPCQACLKICPTGALIGPGRIDARRCIAYLTIEHQGDIPMEWRAKIGNRVFGCDDCQMICPVNQPLKVSAHPAYQAQRFWTHMDLLHAWHMDEATFDVMTQGSPIRRVGYTRWMRNVAVALGNAPYDAALIEALKAYRGQRGAMVDRHIDWALERQEQRIPVRMVPWIQKAARKEKQHDASSS